MKNSSKSTENMERWREQAEALFFIEHLRISDIAVIVKKARETVSRHLNDCDNYENEIQFRRALSAEKRKEYSREWEEQYRNAGVFSITAESLKREHETAVRVLSSEKF